MPPTKEPGSWSWSTLPDPISPHKQSDARPFAQEKLRRADHGQDSRRSPGMNRQCHHFVLVGCEDLLQHLLLPRHVVLERLPAPAAPADILLGKPGLDDIARVVRLDPAAGAPPVTRVVDDGLAEQLLDHRPEGRAVLVEHRPKCEPCGLQAAGQGAGIHGSGEGQAVPTHGVGPEPAQCRGLRDALWVETCVGPDDLAVSFEAGPVILFWVEGEFDLVTKRHAAQ